MSKSDEPDGNIDGVLHASHLVLHGVQHEHVIRPRMPQALRPAAYSRFF